MHSKIGIVNPDEYEKNLEKGNEKVLKSSPNFGVSVQKGGQTNNWIYCCSRVLLLRNKKNRKCFLV